MNDSIPELGRLDEVDLRSVWNSEPHSFTPWLAKSQNLQFLAESLELPGLELVRTEHPVDSFSADIVCKIVDTDHYVLIENQLERTDHVHLGQLLTYAPRFDSSVVIWVARSFTDAHRAALDWLNWITSERYGFFGVEVRAVKIGDSEPAPLFEVVSKPNEWVKPDAAANQDAEALTELHSENIEYWSLLDERLQQNGKVQRRNKKQVKGQNLWLPLSRDSSVYIVPFRSFASKKHVGVYLGIYGDRADDYWSSLEENREQLEQIFSTDIEWDTNKSGTVHKVLSPPFYSDSDKSNWEEQQSWLIDRINHYFDVFEPAISDIATGLNDKES